MRRATARHRATVRLVSAGIRRHRIASMALAVLAVLGVSAAVALPAGAALAAGGGNAVLSVTLTPVDAGGNPIADLGSSFGYAVNYQVKYSCADADCVDASVQLSAPPTDPGAIIPTTVPNTLIRYSGFTPAFPGAPAPTGAGGDPGDELRRHDRVGRIPFAQDGHRDADGQRTAVRGVPDRPCERRRDPAAALLQEPADLLGREREVVVGQEHGVQPRRDAGRFEPPRRPCRGHDVQPGSALDQPCEVVDGVVVEHMQVVEDDPQRSGLGELVEEQRADARDADAARQEVAERTLRGEQLLDAQAGDDALPEPRPRAGALVEGGRRPRRGRG